MSYWEKILNEILNQRTQEKIHPSLSSTQNVSKNKTKNQNYFLGERFPGIYLTQREAECMSNFLQKKTVSEAAQELNLSPRTVEFYLKNMKVKLECKTKTELLHKIQESDFSKNYLNVVECEHHD